MFVFGTAGEKTVPGVHSPFSDRGFSVPGKLVKYVLSEDTTLPTDDDTIGIIYIYEITSILPAWHRMLLLALLTLHVAKKSIN